MATTSRVKKRIRVSRKPKSCPNPLFEKWLMELKDDAVRKESRLQYVYGKVNNIDETLPYLCEAFCIIYRLSSHYKNIHWSSRVQKNAKCCSILEMDCARY